MRCDTNEFHALRNRIARQRTPTVTQPDTPTAFLHLKESQFLPSYAGDGLSMAEVVPKYALSKIKVKDIDSGTCFALLCEKEAKSMKRTTEAKNVYFRTSRNRKKIFLRQGPA
jgi:hypothetical protein